MMIRGQLIAKLQALTSRRRWSLRLAILLRNQCQCVIRNAFNDSNDIRGNGESLLVSALAKQASWVVDVGANVGDWTAEVLRLQPGCQARLFDPSRQAVEALQARFGGKTNIEIASKGLSNRSGHLTSFEESGAGKTSSFAPGFSQADAQRWVVETATLDGELSRRGITHVDLLKVDAEGYDMQVLRGASGLIGTQGVDAIQFEYNAP